MADSEAKKKWDRENTILVTIKLFRASNGDIIEWLKGKENKSAAIKEVLSDYVAGNLEEREKCPWQ